VTAAVRSPRLAHPQLILPQPGPFSRVLPSPELIAVRVRRRLLALAVVLSGAASISGCGRPATEAECDEIVGRIAELELKEAKNADPTDVQKQVAETKQAFHDKTRSQCVGKRVTDYALRCVRNAKTAEEIVQKCLD